MARVTQISPYLPGVKGLVIATRADNGRSAIVAIGLDEIFNKAKAIGIGRAGGDKICVTDYKGNVIECLGIKDEEAWTSRVDPNTGKGLYVVYEPFTNKFTVRDQTTNGTAKIAEGKQIDSNKYELYGQTYTLDDIAMRLGRTVNINPPNNIVKGGVVDEIKPGEIKIYSLGASGKYSIYIAIAYKSL